MDKTVKRERSLELGISLSSGYKTSSEKFLYSLVVYCLTKFWWCNIKRFLSYYKIASANLCKPIHDIIKYSTSIYPFETEKFRKEGKNYKNLNISRSKRGFLDEIKTSFHKFWSAIILWKNKNLIKNSGNKP